MIHHAPDVSGRGSRRAVLVLLAGMAACAAFVAPAIAGESEFDGHLVHHNVVTTSFLTPEVARAYDIRRSGNRALVNVTVMEKGENGMRTVPAKIRGRAVNLNQQVKFLGFRTVHDGEAVYQLAEVPVRGGEELTFELDVSPQGSETALPVRFSQTFYGN